MTTVKVWIKKPGQKDDGAVGVDILADSIVQTLKETYLGTKTPSHIAALSLKCGGTELSNRRTYQSYLDELPTLANATLIAEDGDKTDVIGRLEQTISALPHAVTLALQRSIVPFAEAFVPFSETQPLIGKFDSLFEMQQLMYENWTSSVWLVKVSGKQTFCVVKFIGLDVPGVPMEVTILSQLQGCPFIVSILWHGGVDNSTKYALASPLYSPQPYFPSSEAVCDYMHQLLQALMVCAQHSVVHGDLSPSNVLYDPRSMCIKLIDFGMASSTGTRWKGSLSGTREYMAPERLLRSGRHHPSSDIWSAGKIFHEICAKLSFSSDADDLQEKMLHKDQRLRITAEEALGHPFFALYKPQQAHIQPQACVQPARKRQRQECVRVQPPRRHKHIHNGKNICGNT